MLLTERCCLLYLLGITILGEDLGLGVFKNSFFFFEGWGGGGGYKKDCNIWVPYSWKLSISLACVGRSSISFRSAHQSA